jgi:hypothetical protein
MKMTTSQLALADELAAIRAEIARLQSRESTLASIQHDFPKIPVFRRSPVQRDPSDTLAITAAHV